MQEFVCGNGFGERYDKRRYSRAGAFPEVFSTTRRGSEYTGSLIITGSDCLLFRWRMRVVRVSIGQCYGSFWVECRVD